MLHHQRLREAARAAAEANGESFWSADFPQPARVQMWHFIEAMEEHGEEVTEEARRLILVDEGLLGLLNLSDPVADFKAYLLNCDDDMMPTVIEAWLEASRDDYQDDVGNVFWAGDLVERFTESVKAVLLRHRIAFDLIDGQMVEIESRELHSAVVAPVLRLLARSDGAWSGVEKSYRAGLDELTRGDPGDAITDAGTALQEALEAVGAKGNSLGPLIKSARTLKVLAGHDEGLAESVQKAAEWVSADRSQSGDAHHSADANADDAWLILHVAGALILRLSKGGGRG